MTSIRGNLPRSVNAVTPNGIGKCSSLSTTTIRSIHCEGNTELPLARVATRDGCIKTRRPQPATPATRTSMCTGAGWARSARTATAYETGNSGTLITIHGHASNLMADTKGAIVMRATPSAWTRRSHHRRPVSDVTRRMTSMREVSAHNVTGVMKQRSGRR